MEKRIAYFFTLVCTLLCLSGMTKAQGCAQDSARCCKKSRLTLGGYGEAVMSRMFYSDNINRYSKAEKYKNAKSRGQADLPHVVVMLGYNFGKGWTMNSEIEFEHGGTESAMEMEDEEFGEWEGEIERGGEVALEQFWIQKSFCPELNICAGHGWRILGGLDYGHLGDADIISTYNRSQSSTSPYKRTLVGNRAHAASIQAGYNVLRFFPCMRSEKQQLFVFGAYENYDAYHPVAGNSDYEWTDRSRIAFGFNYHPTKQIVVKGEYSNRFLKSKFNNEPSISLGIAYAGFFL